MSVQRELYSVFQVRDLASEAYLNALRKGQNPAALPGYSDWRDAQRLFQRLYRKPTSANEWSALRERYAAIAALNNAD